MGLPEGQYVQIVIETPMHCIECDRDDDNIAVSNEIVFDDSALVGIDAVVRFTHCGHIVPGAEASPIQVAQMLEKYGPSISGTD